MLIIIQTMDIMPDYFKTFCSIISVMSCYNSLVKSLVTCYVVYKNEMQIRKYIDIDKVLLQFKASLTRSEILELSENANVSTSREELFIKILQQKSPKFTDNLMNYLALEDCPNHSKLYQHLQSLKDNFHKNLRIPSVVSYLPGIKRYQDFLKRFYLDTIQVKEQDTFNGNIHQYINLSMITPQNQENNNEYFKALRDPHHLLFNHKEYTTTVPLKSLAEIFNTSESTPQTILVQGSPGRGKTTLANKICIDWAKGNLIQHYILAILLKLRDPRISDIESINDIVNCTMDNNFVSEVVRDIKCIDGETILLLLEGWDELPEDKQQKSFVANIISGKVLKRGSILITSRPSSIGSIPKRFITHHIAILGFSEDQIEQYLDHCFTDQRNELKDGLKYRFLCQLNCNPILKSLAYVPVNLSILVYVFTQCGATLPSTLTELYQQYVLLKLSLHDQRVSGHTIKFIKFDCLPVYIFESLNGLSEIAYSGLRNHKLYFTQNEMQSLYQSVPLDCDGMGLLQVENHMLHRGCYKTYHFMHKTVQEFLAAWYMTKIPEQNVKILEHFQNKNFQIVLIFYAGLTGFKCLEFSKFLPFVDSCYNRKSKTVKLLDKISLTISFKIFFRNYNTGNFFYLYANAGVHSELNGHGLLVLIACCAEAKNPAACKAFSNSELFHNNACYITIPYSAVTLQLLCSLSYCIAHSAKNWIVQCDYLSEQGILSLQKHIFDSNDSSGKLISLTTNTSKKEIDVLNTFLQPCFSLFHLNLSNSHEFGDHCATLLAKALEFNHTLAILSLSYCDISSAGILAIAEMLKINDNLVTIHLEGNTFSCNDLLQVLVKIKNNITLSFMVIDVSLQKLDVVKNQLALFNRRRRNHLRLSVLQFNPLLYFVKEQDD